MDVLLHVPDGHLYDDIDYGVRIEERLVAPAFESRAGVWWRWRPSCSSRRWPTC
ncbi:MAG TPA: hypothetical protein VIA06_09690 [Candidatus Dormibacteraeota bacterium]|nr:hypothetical protein [Candidatus Dormibacteraeota bacterium]